MSIIENKIISMDFDNKKFQKGISETISSLDSFTKKINGLAGGDKIFASLASSVEKIESKFNILHLTAVNVLSDIAMQAIQTGKQLLKSLSLDQITAGFQKFSNITVATSTILSAAPEKTLKEVEAIVERLSLFTDETSYNLETMVDTIGKFVSAGRDLDKSSVTMMGISTWAAEAGANAEQATRAMNQLAQALGRGYFILQDWQSIQTLNMDTRAVKEQLIQAAEAAGTLKKLEDGIWQTNVAGAGKIQVTLDNFSQTITQGRWLTTQVFEDAMGVYGRMAYDLMDLYSALTDDTVDFVESASFSQEAYNKLSKYIESEDIVIDTTTDLIRTIREAGLEVDEYGLKLFENAQVAKTWEDVINSVKDAASTKWSNVFGSVIGNLDEAKAVFTKISERLWDVFAGPIDNLGSAFKEWEDLGGRDLLFGEDEDSQGAVWNLVDALSALGEVVQRVIVKLFGDISGENLFGWTEKLRDWTEGLILNDRQIESWANTIVDVVNVVRNLFSLLKSIGNLLSPLTGGAFSSNLISTIQNITNFYSNAINFILTRTTKLVNALARVVRPIVKQIKEAWNNIFGSNIYGSAKKFVDKVLNKIISFLDRLRKDKDSLEAIGGTFEAIFGVVKDVYEIFKLVKDEIKDILGLSRDGDLYDFVMTIFGYASGLKEYTGRLKDGNEELDKTRSIISDVGGVIQELFSTIWSIIERIGSAFASVFFEDTMLDGFTNSVHTASEDAKGFFRLFNLSSDGPNAVNGINQMGDNFEEVFRNVFSILRSIVEFSSSLLSTIVTSFTKAFKLDDGSTMNPIISLLSFLDNFFKRISGNEKLMGALEKILDGLFYVLSSGLDVIVELFKVLDENIFQKMFGDNFFEADGILGLIGDGFMALGDGLSWLKNAIAGANFEPLYELFDKIGTFFQETFSKIDFSWIKDVFSSIGGFFKGIIDWFTPSKNGSGTIVEATEALSEGANEAKDSADKAPDASDFQSSFGNIIDIFKLIVDASDQIWWWVKGAAILITVLKVVNSITGFGYAVRNISDSLWNITLGIKRRMTAESISKILNSFTEMLVKVALTIGIVVGSIVLIGWLCSDHEEELKRATIIVGVIAGVILAFTTVFLAMIMKMKNAEDQMSSAIFDWKKGITTTFTRDALAQRLRSLAEVMAAIGAAVILISAAVSLIMFVAGNGESSGDKMWAAVAFVAVVMAAMTALSIALWKMATSEKMTDEVAAKGNKLSALMKSISKVLKSIAHAMISFSLSIILVSLAGKWAGTTNMIAASVAIGSIAIAMLAMLKSLTKLIFSTQDIEGIQKQLPKLSLYIASLGLMLGVLGASLFKIATGIAIVMAAMNGITLTKDENGFSFSMDSSGSKVGGLAVLGAVLIGLIWSIGGIMSIMTKVSQTDMSTSQILAAGAKFIAMAVAFDIFALGMIPLLGSIALIAMVLTEDNENGVSELNIGKLLGFAAGLVSILLIIATMAKTISYVSEAIKSTESMLVVVGAFIAMAGVLAIIGMVLGNLVEIGGEWYTYLAASAGLSLVLVAIAGALILLNKFSKNKADLLASAAAIAIVGIVLSALGFAIAEMAKLDQGNIWSSSAAVMAMIAVIGIVLGLMSKLNTLTLLGASATIAILLFSLAGAVVMIGNAVKNLTEAVDASKLNAVVEAISKLIDILWKFFLASIIVTAVIAGLAAIPAIGQLIAIAAVAVLAGIAVVVFSLSSLVEAIGRAILNLGTGIDLLATGLEKLHKVSYTLNETFVNIRNALGTLREIIKDALKIIREAAHEIVKTLAYIISQGIRLIAEVIASSFEAILEVIDEHKETVANRLLSLFLFLADTIASNGDIIGKAFVLMFDTTFDVLMNSLDLLFAKISGKLKDYVAHDNILRFLYWVGSGESIDDYITYAVTRRDAVKMQTGADIDKLIADARERNVRGRGNQNTKALEELKELVRTSKELQSILPYEKNHFHTVDDVVNALIAMSPEELNRKLSENVEGYTITLDFYKKEIKDKLAAVGKDLSSTGSNAVGSIFDAINKKWTEFEDDPDSALNKIKGFFGEGNNGFTIDINANADGLLGAADDATDSIQKIFGDMDMDWGDIFDTNGLINDTDEAMSALENRHQAYWVKVQQAEADSASGETTVTNTFYITSNDPEAVGRTINKQLAREKRRTDTQW